MHALLFDWPYAGLALAAALVAVLVREALGAGAPAWRSPGWVLGWVWPMYLLHMFEEHGIDLLGRRYAFLGFLCDLIGRPLDSGCPATPAFVFTVNVIPCQTAFALAFFLRRSRPLVAACAWGIPLINLSLSGGAGGGQRPEWRLAAPRTCRWQAPARTRSGLSELAPPGAVMSLHDID